MLESLPQASTYAADIDNLILFIGIIVGVWFFLAEGIFFWLIWKFRAKPNTKSQYLVGKEKHVKRWITIPHALVLVCDVFIIIGAVRVWYNVKQQLPEPDSTIRIIGQQCRVLLHHGAAPAGRHHDGFGPFVKRGQPRIHVTSRMLTRRIGCAAGSSQAAGAGVRARP